MLTVTVNRRNTFRAGTIAKAKQQASRIANKNVRESDWMRIFVSSGTIEVAGKKYNEGSEFWMKRFNTMSPAFKAGEWQL